MFVVDASVVACWYFPDESHPKADAAAKAIANGSATTPALFWFELRNLLLVGERGGRISQIETARLLKLVGALPIEMDREPDEGLVLSLARTHKLTVYDATYLEVALRRMLPLATLDRSIVRAAKAEKVPLIGV
jgi:predicted nucleic acid-binding protein